MNIKQKLENITVKTKSNWLKKSEARSSNRWLKLYSSEISRRVIYLLKEKDMSQIDLASVLDVKPQRVNKIIKGKENLTLETIYKLSEALNFQLITFPKYGWSFSEKTQFEYIRISNMESQNFINDIKEVEISIPVSSGWIMKGEQKYTPMNTNLPFIGDILEIEASDSLQDQ